MMSVRAFVVGLLEDDGVLTSILGVPTVAMFSAPAADEIGRQAFLVIRWGLVNPGISGVNRLEFNVWFHDQPADYEAKITPALRRVRELFGAVSGAKLPNAGGVVNCITWQGDSSDLTDEVLGTISRNSAYMLVGSGT